MVPRQSVFSPMEQHIASRQAMEVEAANHWSVSDLIQRYDGCFCRLIEPVPQLPSQRVRDCLQVSADRILVPDKLPASPHSSTWSLPYTFVFGW